MSTISITKADIGRKIRLRGGAIYEVKNVLDNRGWYPVVAREISNSADEIGLTLGGRWFTDKESNLDAVAFVDEPTSPTVTSNGVQRFELLKAVAQGLAANPSHAYLTAGSLATLAHQITKAIEEQVTHG